ncbi:MAG: glycosyltransferase family 2 protein [Desulfovibrionaceae bacterium]|nr:glycosyltransferase family 2 protein [Desulfovibrionaceae bacterium]MBF0512474.1 glycosyltransferase family 2 protein [Desulfovibrionaceae bacterium]
MNSASNISAVVLTLNEAANLPRCLASLAFSREIVVVDSGSCDATAAIAASLGAKVFTHVPDGGFQFAAQRNWALDHCGLSGDWVFFLDADEVAPEDLARELTRICAPGETDFDAFELTPRYLFWGKWLKRTQGYPNWHPRLVRRGRARFAGEIWEHFSEGVRVGRIDVPYDHYANSKGFGDWLARHDRYSTQDAAKIVDFLSAPDRGQVLGTARKLRLRKLAARLWPLRPFARFFLMYVLRGGFLEGFAALMFCLMYFFYELMIVIKIIEQKRLRRGEAL